ncbi:MAG: hypothetical protein NW206_15980 [Hyphomonadaceae bacterium]|nr:hypothetical protein [Hyphomonadaceae bacterium]
MSGEAEALEAIWQVMVELAEAGNDEVVNTQAATSKDGAARIGVIAGDLAALAEAAAVLARRTEAAP